MKMKVLVDQIVSEDGHLKTSNPTNEIINQEEESMDCIYLVHEHVKDYKDDAEHDTCMYCVSQEIQELISEFVLDDAKYEKVAKLLLQEMDKGLSKKNRPIADLKMYQTYVRSLPNGKEKGNILALDLGGTNFRVLLIKLDGQKEPEMLAKIYPIAHDIMVGKGTQLFDHIAECIAKFMEEHNIEKKDYLPLGFTFSFPCKQIGLNVGKLMQWTKGFKCEGVEGKDVVKLLHEAIDRRGVCVKGPNVFKGYLKQADKTAEVLDADNWLHTGDIGCWLENGALKLIDRKKHIFKLAQGEYIAPEKIENIYIRSPAIAQFFIHGDSLKSSLVGIAVVDPETIQDWAKSKSGLQTTIEEICQNSEIKKFILEDLTSIGKKAGLQSFEQVRDIYVHPELFSVENGLLTPTFKSKRQQIQKHFTAQISEMYEHLQ